MNEPTLPGGINANDVLRYLAGGAAGGTALGSIALALRAHATKKREAEQLKDEAASTLTFDLPSDLKAAEYEVKKPNYDGDQTGSFKKSVKVEGSKRRASNGKYDTDKRANWQTAAAALLAGGIGAGGAYMGLNALYDKYQIAKAEKELEEAQREYLDILNPSSAVGDDLDEVDQYKAITDNITEDEEGAAIIDTKKAADQDFGSFGAAHAPGALAALLGLLGIGGTAYGVKSLLDNANPVDKPVGPKGITRVVFDDPNSPNFKEASAGDIVASTAVMLDVISGDPVTTGSPEMAPLLKAAGLTPADLYKSAMVTPELLESAEYKDTENLLNLLSKHEDVRRGLQRVGMNSRPILKHFKWTLDLPFVGDYADKKLYEHMSTAGLNSNTSGTKYSSDLLTAALAANVTKDTLEDDSQDRIADPDKPDVEDLRDATSAVDSHDGVFAKRVEVDAADPKAKAFLEANMDKILTALRDVSARGAAY